MSANKPSYALNNLAEHLTSVEEMQYFAHDAAMLAITGDLEEEMERSGVSKAEMARLLGKTPAFVSQVLNGGRNMTIKTIADVALALGLQVRGLEFSRLGEMRVPYEVMDTVLDQHGASSVTSEARSGTYQELSVGESQTLLVAA